MGRTDRKNVFIIGAGASAEFGLPTGRALLDDISKLASTSYRHRSAEGVIRIDDKLKGALQELTAELHGIGGANMGQIGLTHQEAAWICSNARLAPSIDNLLHSHKDNRLLNCVGKILIAHALLTAEGKSSLSFQGNDRDRTKIFSQSSNNQHTTETWLGQLFWLLVEQRSFDEFLKAIDNITFISFNYDRCIEQFLLHAAWSYFKLERTDVIELQKRLKVVRPYGGLGLLTPSSDRFLGFGSVDSDLLKVSKGIRTFTEGVEESTLRNQIRSILNDADLVFFMGFGFISLNMKLLFDGSPLNVKRAVGTRLGISEESTSIICNSLQDRLFFGNDSDTLRVAKLPVGSDRLELSNMSCSELLRKHQFFLRDYR